MTLRGERLEARERVIRCAVAVIAAERSLVDDPRGAANLTKAEADLEYAARDCTNAIDDLPPGERPKDWAAAPDGRTA